MLLPAESPWQSLTVSQPPWLWYWCLSWALRQYLLSVLWTFVKFCDNHFSLHKKINDNKTHGWGLRAVLNMNLERSFMICPLIKIIGDSFSEPVNLPTRSFSPDLQKQTWIPTYVADLKSNWKAVGSRQTWNSCQSSHFALLSVKTPSAICYFCSFILFVFV